MEATAARMDTYWNGWANNYLEGLKGHILGAIDKKKMPWGVGVI